MSTTIFNYIEPLAEFAKQVETEIRAYCLMPNHVHLVMVPSHEDDLRAALGEAHRRYTRHVNCRQGWLGHLWQERSHSFLMDERYLMTAARCVEMNPGYSNDPVQNQEVSRKYTVHRICHLYYELEPHSAQ